MNKDSMHPWYEIEIRTTEEASEAIAEFLISIGALGVAVQNPFEFQRILEEERKFIFSDDFEPQESDVIIKAYYSEQEQGINTLPKLEQDENPFWDLEQELYTQRITQSLSIEDFRFQIEEKLQEMSEYLDLGAYRLEMRTIQEEDWANDWKKYYHPIEINDRLLITPSWIKPEAKENQIVIELDPGSAFGTGSHETTALCLKLMTQFAENKKKVLDLGCGSGILAIAAEKLGAEEVLALDLDAKAVQVSLENIAFNQCTKISASQGSLDNLKEEKFDFIVANILAEVLAKLLPDMLEYLEEGAYLLMSGIIATKEHFVTEVAERLPLKLIQREEQKDWVALLYQKQS